MEVFEITKEMMTAAKTYMPLDMKTELARSVALKCLRPMETAKENHPADELISLPLMKEEDCGIKAKALMVTLLQYYFGIEELRTVEADGEELFDYDYYAGGHIMNQIERFKSDRDTKDAAFDLIEDFREFKAMVNAMIYNEKANANDPLERFLASIAVLSTPENVRVLTEELKKATDEYAEKTSEGAKGKVLDMIHGTEG